MINAIHKLCCTTAVAVALVTTGCIAETPPEAPSAGAMEMVVYHDPNCGCCGKWIEHMEQHGFSVESVHESNMSAIKRELGVPENLPSCHTATVGGYVIEGHVPADDVMKLLDERPDAKGLSVPGMPLGSPGMEYGETRHAFDVVSFDKAGGTEIFNHYPAIKE
ncbi:MAG: DUF411 domain-containing protein [Wenzhouxiangellaceae bacterium]